ncbi:hypothetical protein F511_35022 [Dorcoceras hygrometricum]|uniref:Uncharacterized protein n=1 Tax=Dorcoceras hygrometricum TaxID=472368 RepID=A0A2Z7CFQ2_9LAMI|nr:hypothetical protein F511_35022 [Dorcoceras hygrometricum]
MEASWQRELNATNLAPNGVVYHRQTEEIDYDLMNSRHRHTGLTYVCSSNLSAIPDLTPLRYTNLRPLNDVAQESNRFEHLCTIQFLFPTDLATSTDHTTQLLPTSVKADNAKRRRTAFTIASLKRHRIATQIRMIDLTHSDLTSAGTYKPHRFTL